MIILDTHAWIWWVARPEELSPRASQAIADADELGVCTISCWEVAMLVSKRRLELDRPVSTWVDQALHQPKVRALPLTWEIALAAGTVAPGPGEHGDPADRIIAATATSLNAGIVTKDERLRQFPWLPAIW